MALMSMIARSFDSLGPHGFHRVAYWEWPGPAKARSVICAHGLTRNGRDFDRLAQVLSAEYRVVCADIVGRGKSDWLADPKDYDYSVYLADLAALIARLDVAEVDWVGTSMGGLLGMMMAAKPRAPIRRLVINDIGPLIAKEGLTRIGSYVGRDPSFRDAGELEATLRQVAASFGLLSDAQWRHLAAISTRRKPDGSLGFAYDPHIGDAFRNAPAEDIDLWSQWDRISCPTLVLRGAQSDLLRPADAEAMTQRGPKARLVEFPGIGHAPALMADDQIAAIRDFLLG
jgi:pimeloyl-ACP methyl ester carboxylesterase